MFYNLLYPLAEQFPIFNLFQYITVRAGGAMVTTLLLTLFFGPKIIRKFREMQRHYKTVREDLPERHAKTKVGTPSMGGVMIYGSMLISTLLWADLTNMYIWLALGTVTAYATIGFIDDFLKMSQIRKGGVPGKIRLLAGILVSLGVIYVFGQVLEAPKAYDVFIPFVKNYAMPLGMMGFMVFGTLVIVGTANAVNLTDGLDGLATVPALIAAGSFAAIAYVVGRADFTEYIYIHYIPGAAELTIFCAAIVGACLGFLWFNAPPASIFMGDTGSLTLGSSLGVVAVLTKHELVLAIIGGVFVLETLSVMIQVFSFKVFGRRVFLMAPLHHHFEQKGWAESQIVIRFWIIAILFALVGLATLKLR